MGETTTNQAVRILLDKESEIFNKFHQAMIEIMRLGYDTKRGKDQIQTLINSVQYSLEDIERLINNL